MVLQERSERLLVSARDILRRADLKHDPQDIIKDLWRQYDLEHPPHKLPAAA